MASAHRGLQPRKQPRQVRAELTRQRILTAAAHIFAEYGYAAGTTNRIAEQARISIGSLYQYYPNKDAILVELLIRHLDDGIATTLRRQAQELPESLEGILRAHVRSVIENHRDDPQLLRVMFEQAPRSPELFERVARYKREHVAHTEELLISHPEARVQDTHVAALLVVSVVEQIIHQLVAAPDAVDSIRLENELVAMLTRYLTGEPSK